MNEVSDLSNYSCYLLDLACELEWHPNASFEANLIQKGLGLANLSSLFRLKRFQKLFCSATKA